jgi:hypothetical protein
LPCEDVDTVEVVAVAEVVDEVVEEELLVDVVVVVVFLEDRLKVARLESSPVLTSRAVNARLPEALPLAEIVPEEEATRLTVLFMAPLMRTCTWDPGEKPDPDNETFVPTGPVEGETTIAGEFWPVARVDAKAVKTRSTTATATPRPLPLMAGGLPAWGPPPSSSGL